MKDYLEELRAAYSVGKLYFDFIYVGVYAYLLSNGAVPAPDTTEFRNTRVVASQYYQRYVRLYPRKLQEIRGETLYESDLKEQSDKVRLIIDNLTKKLFVYEFIISGRDITDGYKFPEVIYNTLKPAQI